MRISKIILYNEPSVPEINIKKAEKFLIETFDVEIQIRENIFKKLDKNDVVIGPATDGGYYLIGLKKLHPKIFQNKYTSLSIIKQRAGQ